MSDPTGTAGLRRSFRAEGGRRLAALRSQTHAILVGADLMAARNDPLAALMPNPGHRLAAFSDWFRRTASYLLLGQDWWSRFLERAYGSGNAAGAALVGTRPGPTLVPAVYRELSYRELEGIVAAMTQQVTRVTAMAALGQLKPARIYREVSTVLRKVGEARLKMGVDTMTVQLHNAARLAAFRQAGVTRIGIDPERLEPPRPSRFGRHHDHHLVLDETPREAAQAAVEAAQEAVNKAQQALDVAESAAATAEAKLEVAQLKVQTEEAEVAQVDVEVAAAESRRNEVESEDPATPNHAARLDYANTMVERADAKLARAEERLEAAKDAADEAELEGERTAAEAQNAREDLDDAQAALEEAQAKLAAAEEAGDLVNVLTAGDDKVCQICLDLAADGPYTLEESETLLPAHPNCRCAWIPADEPADKGD